MTEDSLHECKKCNSMLPRTEFFKNSNMASGYQSACKECQNKRPLANKELVQRYKMRLGCKQCGYKENPVALQLNHLDPMLKIGRTKNGKVIESALSYYWSRARVKQEVRKCEVLCANCHTVKTHSENQYSLRKT
jgi:hypothetical protein